MRLKLEPIINTLSVVPHGVVETYVDEVGIKHHSVNLGEFPQDVSVYGDLFEELYDRRDPSLKPTGKSYIGEIKDDSSERNPEFEYNGAKFVRIKREPPAFIVPDSGSGICPSSGIVPDSGKDGGICPTPLSSVILDGDGGCIDEESELYAPTGDWRTYPMDRAARKKEKAPESESKAV